MRVNVWTTCLLLFYCTCAMERILSEKIKRKIVVTDMENSNANGKYYEQLGTWNKRPTYRCKETESLIKWDATEKAWILIDSRGHILCENKSDTDTPEDGWLELSFECYSCYEPRFVSLKPLCDHEICAKCFFQKLRIAEDEGSDFFKKCAMCRRDVPKLDDHEVSFHKICDLKKDEYQSALIMAAQEGRIDVIKFLVKEKANLNQAAFNGVTPLLIAAQRGHIDVVKYLAENLVDLNKAADNGATPIHIASKNGHIDIVQFLVTKGVDLNKADDNAATPVHVAALKGHTEIVKILIESHADVDESLLSIAATEEIKQIFSKTLEKN